jgi:hypothetical protein
MTGSSTTNSNEPETGRYPEPVGDQDDADVRHVASDTEDVEPDEAGYGYGV